MRAVEHLIFGQTSCSPADIYPPPPPAAGIMSTIFKNTTRMPLPDSSASVDGAYGYLSPLQTPSDIRPHARHCLMTTLNQRNFSFVIYRKKDSLSTWIDLNGIYISAKSEVQFLSHIEVISPARATVVSYLIDDTLSW